MPSSSFKKLNEELASSRDFSQIGAISPTCGDNRVRQTFSPGWVKSCGLGVYTGYLSARNEAIGEALRIPIPYDGNKKCLPVVQDSICLEKFSRELFGFIGSYNIVGEQPRRKLNRDSAIISTHNLGKK